MKKPLGKTRGWAAIFFGDTALELATGNEMAVERQTSVPLTEGQDAAIQQLRAQMDPGEHHIVTAIGGEDVLCQMLRLPTADPAELKQMLALQIDNITPLPADEMVYGFEALEVTGGETRLLVAVARKAAVNERVAALEAAGLPAEVVGVDALAVFRELVRQGVVPGDDRLNALVLVSPAAANIIVHLRGHIVAVRSLVTGGEPDVIREELQRTLVATQVEWPGTETGRVQFATWSEPLRAGVAELARGWGAAAEFLGNGSSPTPGASVCLDTARAGATPLNLLPDEWRERRRKAALRRTLIRGGVALGAVYVVALIVFVTLMLVQQARLSGVERKIRGLSAQYDGARTLHKTLVAMQKQLDTKYSALEVLRAVSVLMPENVKLNGYNFKRDDTVTLRAQAQTSALATEFISRLEKCELFAKVAAGSMRSEPATGLTKFDVTCTLKSAALVPATGAHGH